MLFFLSSGINLEEDSDSVNSLDGIFTTTDPTSLSLFYGDETEKVHVFVSPVIVSMASLLSLLIFCSLSVSADGRRAVTLEEPCLYTICAALALHAHHHMMTLASMHRPQQQTGMQACLYNTHTHTFTIDINYIYIDNTWQMLLYKPTFEVT